MIQALEDSQQAAEVAGRVAKAFSASWRLPAHARAKVASLERAFELVSAGSYGLQVGVFTKDLSVVLAAWERLPMGAVIVNGIPAYRSDAMPYGGNRDSGTGREGARYAMEEFTEPRTLVVRA